MHTYWRPAPSQQHRSLDKEGRIGMQATTDTTGVYMSVQCVATVMMLAGVVFFGILIGSLGEIVQHASTRARQAQMFRRKFEDVEAWMRMRRLPKHTQKRIR